MNDQIKEILNKIPYVLVIMFYVLWSFYKYYDFTSSSTSPLRRQQNSLKQLEDEITKLKNRKKEIAEFEKNLDVKREELRTLAQRLNQTKSTLSEELDVPVLIKTVITEAKRVGLRVEGLTPKDEREKEFYVEKLFELPYTGVFAQLVVFLDRIADVNSILRVDTFTVSPTGSQSSRFVEVSGIVEVKAFRYSGSKADEVAKDAGVSLRDRVKLEAERKKRESNKTRTRIIRRGRR